MPTASLSPPVIDMEKYRARLIRYVQYLLHDAAEAEDLTQETFIRANQQQGTLRDPAALASWLYRIATSISLDRLRQQKRTSGRYVDVPVEELPIVDRAQPSPFTVIQQAEMSECVDRYVAVLPDKYKAVLLLHDADGLTAEEIARLLGLPLTTVKMRLHRARQRLKGALDNACAFGCDDRGVLICEPKPGKR
jgi:RNA polymerase sigma-70 factor, ECF subfamily